MIEIITGDALRVLKSLPDQRFHCCVTSPPYWRLRKYTDSPEEMGWEDGPDSYVAALMEVIGEVHRVLRDDGTFWLNVSDRYSKRMRDGAPLKSLLGIPARIELALIEAGWHVRNEIIWHKTNAMPSSVRDACTPAHERIFFLTKQGRYWSNFRAIRTEPSVNTITRQPPRREGSAPKADRQRGHGRRHAGFNDRWDAMSKAEHMALGANRRDVWPMGTANNRGPPGKFPAGCRSAASGRMP